MNLVLLRPLSKAGWDGARIRRVLARLPGLEPQPAEFQSELKASYYLHGARPEAIDELRRILRALGLRASVLYSSDRDLDVLRTINRARDSKLAVGAVVVTPGRVVEEDELVAV